mmetsp:Transcript_43609/g.66108  ORF Transcript_43609/g.66108 Transcript_43609/m.66108 type:complete len:379 (+) Transcript_43609:2-1138(+)
MVIISMIMAMVHMRQLPGSRKMAFTLVGMYMSTTVVAIIEANAFGVPFITNVVKELDASSIQASEEYGSSVEDVKFIDALLGVFENMTPENIINDIATSDMLPVIVASVVFGICIKAQEDDGSPTVTIKLIQQINDVVVACLMAVMKVAPFGVASIVFSTAATVDIEEAGKALAWYLLGMWAVMLFHVFVFYTAILVIGAGRNPFPYYKNLIPAVLMALGMSSSMATLPTTKQCAAKNGIRAEVRDLALSLGATINMDGSGIAFIFIPCWLCTVQGIEFGATKIMLSAIGAMVCSVGASPIPSTGGVALVVLAIAGVPINSTFGLIMAVEFMGDRSQTMVNVFGDSVIVAVIDKWFGQSIIDMETAEKKVKSDEDVAV